ncbi:MAG: hypothetical protein ACRD5D_02430 [Candidatus Polarisedimenticolia bacterium]
MRIARVTLPLLLPLIASAAAAEPDLRSVIAGEAARLPSPASARIGERLAAVAGLERVPASCGTPLASALVRLGSAAPPALREAVRHLASRPALAAERVLASRDTRFMVRYAPQGGSGLMGADRDGNGHPDLVDRIAESLPAAQSYLAPRLPGAAAPAPVDVYVTDLGPGLEGYAVPDGEAVFIVLDATLQADRIMNVVLHQTVHAQLLLLQPGAPVWWTEGTAAWLEVAGTGGIASHAAALRGRLGRGGAGLEDDRLDLLPGALLWPLFLSERAGDSLVVRGIWQEMIDAASDPIAATESVLRRSGGALAPALREFAVWNLFTGARDDGRHYAWGGALPEAPLHAVGPDLPLSLGPVEPVLPYGSVAFRLPADGRRGALDVDIRAEGGEPAADLLIHFEEGDGAPVLVPLTIGPDGSGRTAVPWAAVREIWILLRNEGGGPARFDLRAALDPYAPFDLSALSVEAAVRSITVQWSTASEKGLIGWNVYRAESPTGPFRRLNDVALPASGDGVADTGYVFVDEGMRPGRRYYYQVEGLTGAGLSDRSHAVSARLP